MKKVYITSLHLSHGGVEMAISLLANALVRKGYKVKVLCIYKLCEPVYAMNANVEVVYLTNVRPNKEELRDAIKKREVIKFLKEAMYAAKVLFLKRKVIIDAFKGIKEGCVISTRHEHSVLLSQYGNKGVKKIAQLHHDHQFNRKLLRQIRTQYYNIDYFILLTEGLRQEMEKLLRKKQLTKCVVIPNFLEKLDPIGEHRRKKQVIAVGRLHQVKGFDRLIEIWDRYNVKEKIDLKIIGDGEEKDNLHHLIKEKGLDEKVELMGALPHERVMEEMADSLLYLMTSKSEAFPFVLIEAMSKGLPILAFDVRVGPAAIVEEGISGFLIPEGDESLFINKLDYLLKNTQIRMQMSKNAVRRAEAFTEQVVIEQWMNILEA